MRAGIGYDIHPFSPDRKLVLGGIQIPYKSGLAGHSDADVLVHSVADAILGACGERDLGHHFPDTDPKYKGICSLHLLRKIYKMLKKRGVVVINVDSTIIAQEPLLSPYISQMKNNIARTLEVKTEQVGIKATSPEGLGFLGEKKGIACISVAIIKEPNANGIKNI